MKCANARRPLSRFLDGELSEEARETVVRHLERCPKCKQEYEMLVAAESLLRAVEAPDAPQYIVSRTMAEIKVAVPTYHPLWQRTLAFAATVLLVAAGAWFGAILGREMAARESKSEIVIFSVNDVPSLDDIVQAFAGE